MGLNLSLIENLPDIQSKLVTLDSEYIDFEIISKQCQYSDDYWDLTILKDEEHSEFHCKYDFNGIDISYKNYLKYIVLRELFIKRNTVSTVKPRFNRCKRFIRYLQKNKMFYPNLIDKQFISNYLLSVYTSERENKKHKAAIRELLIEIEARHQELNYKNEYLFLNELDQHKMKLETIEGKNDFIPRLFHNKIVSLALKELNDNELSVHEKKISAMIIIIAETGMRIGEFRIIQNNQIESL